MFCLRKILTIRPLHLGMAIKIFQNGHAWSAMSHELYVPSPSNNDPTASPTFLESSKVFNYVQQWENIKNAWSIPKNKSYCIVLLDAHLVFPFWGCITPWAHRWWRRWKRPGSSLNHDSFNSARFNPGSAASHKCYCHIWLEFNNRQSTQTLCNSGHWQSAIVDKLDAPENGD